jgi:mannosyltransferase OCH1-like enzyme
MIIPKLIHQVIIVDGFEMPKLPQGFNNAIKSYKTLNPEYKHTLYTGNKCRKFIKQHFDSNILKNFDKLIPYTYKCDFFRLLVLWVHGGWYADARQVCLKSLDELSSTGHEFYAPLSKPPYNNISLESAFIGCTPKHPIIKKGIDLIMWNIDHEHYGIECLFVTGGGMFMNAGIDYIRKNPDKCNIGQVVVKQGTEEYIVFNNKIFIRRKYNDAEGADNSDVEGTNHYGNLWRTWQVYAQDTPRLED